MRRGLLLGIVALAACSPPPRDAKAFADDPDAAARVVAVCDAGTRRPACAAARVGLTEARRRERMDAYARTFGEP